MASFTFPKTPKEPSFVPKNSAPSLYAYDISSWNKQSRLKSTPSVAIGKAQRCVSEDNRFPGPGSYSSEKIINKSVGVSLKGSRKVKFYTDGPGPGGYDPNQQFSSKYYSFMKSKEQKREPVGPGPTTYKFLAPLSNSHTTSFSKGDRQGLIDPEKVAVPGPGQYNEAKMLHHEKEYSFHKDLKFRQFEAEMKSKTLIPGPGTYDISNARKILKSGFFAKSLRCTAENDVPGPGNYEVKTEAQIKGGCITKEVRQFDYERNVPGPGAYNPVLIDAVKSKQPSIIIGHDKKEVGSNSIVPGPGTYNWKQNFPKEDISFSFPHQQRSNDRLEKSPGPQSYNPQYREFSPASVIGSAKKFNTGVEKTPGPGSYDSQLRKTTNSFSFRKAGFLETGNGVMGSLKRQPRMNQTTTGHM